MIIAGNFLLRVFVFSLADPIAKFDQTGSRAIIEKIPGNRALYSTHSHPNCPVICIMELSLLNPVSVI
jgi:hypothetical protein